MGNLQLKSVFKSKDILGNFSLLKGVKNLFKWFSFIYLPFREFMETLIFQIGPMSLKNKSTYLVAFGGLRKIILT